MLPGRTRWLLLPVDNFVREFHGKLLLAAVAAERGWSTVIAFKHSYFKRNVPAKAGVVIDSGFRNSSRVEDYQRLGWRVSAWDEEGLIYLTASEYCQRRVHEPTLRRFDHIFLWGENQQNDMRQQIRGIDDRLVLSGNPRFDLLRPDLRQYYGPSAEQIRAEHGKYMLVNTNFAVVNHYYGRDYLGVKALMRDGRITTEEQQQDQIAREKHQELIMQAFLDMLPKVSGHFPNRKIIIRPHPSENFDTWRTAAEALPNVSMIHEGDVVPWLMAAEAVVHNSCTTGVQARILGTPVISYMPVTSERYDQYLPNAVSHRAHSVGELVGLLQEPTATSSAAKGGLEQERQSVMQRYVTGLDGLWAAERVMNAVELLDVEPEGLDPEVLTMLRNTAGQARTLRARAKGFVTHLLDRAARDQPVKPASSPNKGDYYRRRFPLLSVQTIELDLARLRGITGRFANVDVRTGAEDWICVFPSTN